MLTLLYHPTTPCPVVHSLQAAVARSADGCLRLQYTLRGDLAQIRIPAPQAPIATDSLWEHTCFEAFIGVQGENSYREFNFSPSSQWAAYAFSAYRERVAWEVDSMPEVALAPFPDKGRAGDGFFLEAVIAASDLPQNTKPLQLSLTAVIETTNGEKSYWALYHPAEHPDFHHRNGFTHEIWP